MEVFDSFFYTLYQIKCCEYIQREAGKKGMSI